MLDAAARRVYRWHTVVQGGFPVPLLLDRPA